MTTTQPRRGSGDGWVSCPAGHDHWGRHGAAGLLLVDPSRHVLLQHRAGWSHFGDTWGLPGGARERDEVAVAAALREAGEEAGVQADTVALRAAWLEDHQSWSYTTVIADLVGDGSTIQATDAETADVRWVPAPEVADYPLHPAFAQKWPVIYPFVARGMVLVVDTANVMGSRPDGWWRDRESAAIRLRDQLGTVARTGLASSSWDLPGDRWWPELIMVTEGDTTGVSSSNQVRVVPAPADGDSTVISTVRERRRSHPADQVLVVTADRELRRRVLNEGATVHGPGTLLAQIGT